MSQYSKAETGSATSSAVPLASNCDNCPRVSTTFSSSTTGGFSNTDTLIGTIGQLHDLQREVKELQDANKKTLSFYESASKLSNTVRVVVIILMIVPIVQLICCVGVVYFLGIEDKLPGLLRLVLSGVSIFSIIELTVGGFKLYFYETKMDKFEKDLDALTNINN
jgi:hypothetical protein